MIKITNFLTDILQREFRSFFLLFVANFPEAKRFVSCAGHQHVSFVVQRHKQHPITMSFEAVRFFEFKIFYRPNVDIVLGKSMACDYLISLLGKNNVANLALCLMLMHNI